MWTKSEKMQAAYLLLLLALTAVYLYFSYKERQKENIALNQSVQDGTRVVDYMINDLTGRVKQLEEKNKPGYFKRLISQVKQNNN